MKYVGIYWTLFAPLMKKSITKRFGKELAEQSISQGKEEYRKLLSHADELGPGNPMATNAYFAYVFAAAWLGSGRRITPEELPLPTPEETSLDDDREELAQAIMELPRKDRDALLLYYYQDMNQEEVAKALNTSPSTVSKRLKHARDKLRTLLERGREL